MIIIDRIVLHAAIIPKGNAPNIPTKPACKFRHDLVAEQKLQQGRGFVFGPTLKMGGVRHVDIECLAARFGVRPDDRVSRLEGRVGRTVPAVADAVFPSLAHVCFGRGADRSQGRERCLESFREALEGGVLVGEQRVSTVGRDLFRQQHRAHGRLVKVGRVAVPDAAEVDGFVLLFQHLDDLREAVDAPDERVLDRLSEVTGEFEKGRWLEVLVAKEDHLMLEECFPDFEHDARIFGQLVEVHIVDFSAYGSSKAVD